MESIDGHFHAMPREFVEAIRSGAFADLVRLERDPAANERLVYRAPAGVAIEPDTSLSPALYDERRIIRALDEMKLDAATVAPPPSASASRSSFTRRTRETSAGCGTTTCGTWSDFPRRRRSPPHG